MHFYKDLEGTPTPGRVNWALDYSPRAMSISHIVKRHWHLIADIVSCELPPLIGFRRTKSLRSILVHSEFSAPNHCDSTAITGHHKFGQCDICALTITVKQTAFPDKGFTHTLTSFSNCKTKFCVYLLECFCGKRYVGSTRWQLHVRVQEHISRIKQQVLEAPLVNHFISAKHEPTDFRVVVLETIQPAVYRDCLRLLLQRESFWIFRLGTLSPEGLNIDLDLSAFI